MPAPRSARPAFTVSTVSSHPLEAIAAEGDGPKWFQLYWPRERELAASLAARAEAAGYQALIVTLDTFLPGWKTRDLQRAWQPFLEGIGVANYVTTRSSAGCSSVRPRRTNRPPWASSSTSSPTLS